MQRVVKIGSTLRNNWKKSVFFSVAGVYAVDLQQKKWADEEHFRGLAREALGYGSQPMHVDAPNYSVTVILNPVASGVKGRTMYEKYCAPLLNLAGLKVSVIRTESDGQAKDIMEIMKDADAVLVAGGDGTVMEVVTGLMRRQDWRQAAKVPIGVLPVGKTNSLANKLFPGHTDQVRLLGEATMSVVRQLKKPHGVMEVENKTVGKKIYAMNKLELGAWKDCKLILEKWFLSFSWMKTYTPQALYARGYLTRHKELLWDNDVDLEWEVEGVEGSVGSEMREAETGGREGGLQAGGREGGLLAWITGGEARARQTAQARSTAQWVSLESGPHHGAGLSVTVDGDQLRAELLPAVNSMGEFTSHGAAVLSGSDEGRLEGRVISSPAILISPRGAGAGVGEGEGVTEGGEGGAGEKEKLICVDGDNIELSGPLLIRYIKDRLTVFCSGSQVPEEKASAPPPGHQPRWANVGNIGLARGRAGL